MDIKITAADGSSATSTGNISLSISLPQIQLVPATKLSQGITGKYYCGLNSHISPPNIAGLIAGLGGDTLRMTPFYRSTTPIWPSATTGEPTIVTTVLEAVALGFQPLLTFTNYWVSTPASWTAFVGQVVRATPGCVYEFENEPNFNPGFSNSRTPQQYLDGMKLTYAAMKAANPAALMAAPCTNASYTTANQTWCAQLMALPGFWNCIDIWSSHPYNQKPETSWLNDTNSVITRVLANLPAGKKLAFMNSEKGWVTSRTGEGAGDPSEGYSKTPFMQRASRGYTHSIFYGLYDDAFGDVGVLGKSWAPIATDAFKRTRAATDASMYVREFVVGGNYNTTGNWYVRTTVPEGSELVCWSVAGDRNARIVVDSPTDGTMLSRMVGGQNFAIPVTAGRQVITVPLTLRARLLSGNRVTFPEFVS